jgi:hypothetical protein
MKPLTAYRRINKLVWMGRLPKPVIMFVDNDVIPRCHGVTFDDDCIARPVILLNASSKHWGKTLIHEMLHVAEPRLPHGKLFDTMVEAYWRSAKQRVKGLKGS